jgi:hypothetical protein
VNPLPTTAGALTPFYLVARAAGLESWALEKLAHDAATGGFMLNDKFVVRAENIQQVTPEGILELSRAAEKKGYAVMAHSLRVLARDKRETPSRSLVAPWPKHYAWQDRKDLCG